MALLDASRAHGTSRLSSRPVRAGAPLLVALAIAACATSPWEPRGGRAEELSIYETAARFIVRHYEPGPVGRRGLEAVCLATGRRSHRVLRLQERGPEWDPGTGLLDRLSGLPHAVVPVSRCAWNDKLEEVHVPSGRPAVVLALSHPSFVGPRAAYVDVASRESENYRFRYRCRVDWRIDQWMVEWCLPPDGRSRGPALPHGARSRP